MIVFECEYILSLQSIKIEISIIQTYLLYHIWPITIYFSRADPGFKN